MTKPHLFRVAGGRWCVTPPVFQTWKTLGLWVAAMAYAFRNSRTTWTGHR